MACFLGQFGGFVRARKTRDDGRDLRYCKLDMQSHEEPAPPKEQLALPGSIIRSSQAPHYLTSSTCSRCEEAASRNLLSQIVVKLKSIADELIRVVAHRLD